MKNIKYKVFANRKKFNIINWIKNSSSKTYESFSDYLIKRNVFPPDNHYWNKALEFYLKSINAKEPVQVEEPVQKPKRRRRKKNNSKDSPE